MNKSRVEFKVSEHIAHVQLCRADKMNALDEGMLAALLAVPEQINQDKTIRAVVLSGQGDNFCAGLDKSSFASIMAGEGLQLGDNTIDDLTLRTHGISNPLQAVAWQWRELAVPVIAALDGVVFGGGLQIALGADMRYASKNAQFSIMEIKWGLIPDMGGSQLMHQLIAADVVKELTFTGRVFDAEQALEYGFLTALKDDPLAYALEIAKQICERSPSAVRASKALLNKAPYLDAEQGLIMESQLQNQIIGKPNQIEAIQAVLEKRSAKFNDNE